MSNRKSANALTRDLLMQIIRYQGGIIVNAEGGIGSKNPHLTRLIEDGLVKLVRRGNRTELSTAKHVGRIIRRTVAVAIDGTSIDKVVCPSCGELCSHTDSLYNRYRWVREKHKFDCEVRLDHLYDSWQRAQEVRNAAKGRPTDVGGKIRHSTRRGKRQDKKRAKLKAARIAALEKKYPYNTTITVTHEQSIT